MGYTRRKNRSKRKLGKKGRSKKRRSYKRQKYLRGGVGGYDTPPPPPRPRNSNNNPPPLNNENSNSNANSNISPVGQGNLGRVFDNEKAIADASSRSINGSPNGTTFDFDKNRP